MLSGIRAPCPRSPSSSSLPRIPPTRVLHLPTIGKAPPIRKRLPLLPRTLRVNGSTSGFEPPHRCNRSSLVALPEGKGGGDLQAPYCIVLGMYGGGAVPIVHHRPQAVAHLRPSVVAPIHRRGHCCTGCSVVHSSSRGSRTVV